MTGSREAAIAEYKTKLELFEKMKRAGEVLEKGREILMKTAISKCRRLQVLQTHTANLISFYFQVLDLDKQI